MRSFGFSKADAAGDNVDSVGMEPAAVRLPNPMCTSWFRRAFVLSLGLGLRLDSIATIKDMLRPDSSNVNLK
jgi:hypothetical protein